MSDLRVKICGLTRADDARDAVEAGADYLGAVLVSGSPRAVDAGAAAELAAGTGVPLALVTADRDPDALAAGARIAGATVLQLHGDEPPETLSRLRDLGEWTLWKAVRIRGTADAAASVERYGAIADALLWDGWHPDRLGGTGVRIPWAEVARVRRDFPPGLELVAAGGLNPENVGAAVELLEPDVVDVSSGVERAPGIKDPERVEAFVRSARAPGSADDRRRRSAGRP